MSKFEGEDRDFDELDLPAGDLSPSNAADETLDFEGAGEVLESADEADRGISPPAEVKDKARALPEKDRLKRLEKKGPGLLEKLTKTSPYVVLLGISLAAILIAILCLFLELKRFGFEIKPAEGAMAPAVQSGPPSTTATA